MSLRPKVVMAGPGRSVRGGVSSVVNGYYACGIEKYVDLTYVTTMEDGSKLHKAWVFTCALAGFNGQLRNADILHVHLSPGASFERKAILVRIAKRQGKRIVIHQHGGDFEDFYYRKASDGKREYIRKIFSYADIVAVLSEGWRDFLSKDICDRDKMVILKNGVVPPPKPTADHGKKNVLYLGQLTRMKGCFDLARAIAIIGKKTQDMTFTLCGNDDSGAFHQRLEALGIKTGVNTSVRLPGWVDEDERRRLFSESSIFVLPSYIEGSPMSLLEAMSHGLACVATPVGGIPGIIRDGENGLLVPKGDPKALAKAVTTLMEDRELRRRLGFAAYNTAKEEFNANDSLKKLIGLYRELI